MGHRITVDVSGRAGGDASDGVSFAGSAATAARHGRRGGDAGNAEPGVPGGGIDLAIVPVASLPTGAVARVGLVGAVARAGERTQSYRAEADVGTEGYVVMLARGGDGGAGGAGGRGEDGGRGHRGRDATQYSHGSNGGPGGDGGDGGDGSDGAAGGAGGRVVVRVDEARTDLLLLVRADVHGGAGGAAGTNGAGGAGGAGGSGGSSYSWSETKWRDESYTDANGQTQTRSVSYTESHSNPGGHSGASGASGAPGRAQLRAGEGGREGEFKIRVFRGATAVAEYDRCFDLALTGFEFQSLNRDGVMEPGERAEVTRVRVKNTGGMPTPPGHRIEVTLPREGWIVPEECPPFVIPRSLAPGEEHVFEQGALGFVLADVSISLPGEPFAARAALDPRAELTSVRRGFDAFANPQAFRITFPLRMPAVRHMPSLSAGDTTRVVWEVENVATKDYGAEGELARHVSVRLVLAGGELGAEDLVFTDTHGADHSLGAAVTEPIALVEAGRAVRLEGQLRVRRGAARYASATVRAELHLGRPDAPDVPRVAQVREFTVRVAQGYDRTTGADLLLVTNNKTSRDEVEGWEALARSYGLVMNVWDVSHAGHLDLARANDEAGGTLAEDFRGRTLVVLDNTCEAPAGAVRSRDLLPEAQLVRAVAEGTRVLRVGGAAKESARFDDVCHVPLLAANAADEHASPAEFVAGHAERLRTRAGEGLVAALARVEKIEVRRWVAAGEVEEAPLKRAAERVARWLERVAPGECWVVSYEMDPAYCDARRLFYQLWRVGYVYARRAVGAESGAALALPADPSAMHGARFAAGDAPRAALLRALDFERRLALLDRVVRGGPELPPALADAAGRSALREAIVADLVLEQRNARAAGFNHGLDRDAIRAALPRLVALAGHAWAEPLALESDAGALVVALAAALTLVAQSHVSFWEYLVPGRRSRAVSRVTRALVAALLRSAFGFEAAGRAVERAVAARVEAEVKALQAAARERATASRQPRREAVQESLCGAMGTRGVRSTADVAGAAVAVKRQSELDTVLGQVRARAEWREQFVGQCLDARRELLMGGLSARGPYRGTAGPPEGRRSHAGVPAREVPEPAEAEVASEQGRARAGG